MSDHTPVPPNRRMTRIGWIMAVALAITLIASLTAAPPTPLTAKSSAFSRSALGYDALAETLQAGGLTVLRSRWQSGLRARPSVPVLLLEPDRSDEIGDDIEEILIDAAESGAPVVLGLPKWQGIGDGRGWVFSVSLRAEDDVIAFLDSIRGLPGTLVRPPDTTGWSSAFDAPMPEIPHNPQLLDGNVSPLVWCDQGVLIGRFDSPWGGPVIVVSDPDLWNTHGLARGDNAAVADQLLESLQATGVIFDEAVHGFEEAPSIWRELTSFPLSLFTANMVALLLLSVIAAAVRFGPPKDVPPRLAPGKAGLIDSTVRLLKGSPQPRFTLHRYFANTLRRMASAIGLPANQTDEELLDSLERLSASRGTRERPSAIAGALTKLPVHRRARRALLLARRIHALREEIVHADR